MTSLARRLELLAPSSTLAVSARAAELTRSGHAVLSLAAGEPDFSTPPHVVAAMCAAAARGETRYPPALGLPALRAAIAQHHSRRYGVTIPPECVAVTPGAKMALWATFTSLLDPGSEVIVPTPCWVSYGPQITMSQGTMVPVPCRPEDRWEIDPQAVLERVSPRTRALVLCSPNNPTGALISPAVAERLGDIALENDLWLICDDIYAELCFGRVPSGSPLRGRPELLGQTIIVDGLSKSHAMTGWRLGYLSGPRSLVDAVGTLLGQTITGTTTFVQHGAIAALTEPHDLDDVRMAYARRAALLTDGLESLGVPVIEPAGGFCLLADFRHRLGASPGALARDDLELAMTLLERHFVATVAGSAFEAPGFLRLSFACSDETIAQALGRIASLLA